jgi:tRNA threonylcarbamoyladenosine biosynthesis protein TsaE
MEIIREDIISKSTDMTRDMGMALGRLLEPGEIVACSGQLGAGKTLFIQGMALGLGTDPKVPVTSPTYTLVHEYPGPKPLYHFDFYRLARIEDVLGLGYEEYFYDEGISAVEWPEKFPEVFPPETLWINLERESEKERKLSFSSEEENLWKERLTEALKKPGKGE